MDLFLREASLRIGSDDVPGRIGALMDGPSFVPILRREPGRSGPGPKGSDPPVLLKGLRVGPWPGLCDPQRERALTGWPDFMLFSEIALPVPVLAVSQCVGEGWQECIGAIKHRNANRARPFRRSRKPEDIGSFTKWHPMNESKH